MITKIKMNIIKPFDLRKINLENVLFHFVFSLKSK